MLTDEGQSRMGVALAGLLEGGSIQVGDGTQAAEAPFDAPPEADAGVVTVAATFPEDTANFEWLERRVLASDGAVLDVEEQDQGRKATGTIWSLTASIEISKEQT